MTYTAIQGTMLQIHISFVQLASSKFCPAHNKLPGFMLDNLKVSAGKRKINFPNGQYP